MSYPRGACPKIEKALIPGLPLNFCKTLFSESVLCASIPQSIQWIRIKTISSLRFSKVYCPQRTKWSCPAVFAMSSGSRQVSHWFSIGGMKRFWASKPPWGSEPPFSPRRLVLRVPAPSAHSEVLLLVTCLISEHPDSSLFIFAAQLTSWICGLVSVLSCGPFSAITPLPHFLFPYLLRLWLDTSGTFSLYLLWLLISFTLSTSLSPRVAFWIISPVHVTFQVTRSLFVCWSAVSLSPLSFWFLFYFISRLLFSRSSLLFFYKDPELIF